jgi:indole-3-glycerol phosphate synthase
MVGNVPVGGGAPIAVQSMTNTNTCDVDATVAQIQAIQDAGADIVRVSVPSMEAAEAFGKIRPQLPDGVLAVAESGVRSPDDVRRARDEGADAVLVGEHVVTATDPTAAVAALCEAGRHEQ